MAYQTPTLFDQEPDPPTPPPAATGFALGIARSEEAATKWSKEQVELVDYTIVLVARRLDEFTADDVWRQLPTGFPVTKGMAARLVSAERKGRIINTGRLERSQRGGEHDHGQRLTVWRRRP